MYIPIWFILSVIAMIIFLLVVSSDSFRKWANSRQAESIGNLLGNVAVLVLIISIILYFLGYIGL